MGWVLLRGVVVEVGVRGVDGVGIVVVGFGDGG